MTRFLETPSYYCKPISCYCKPLFEKKKTLFQTFFGTICYISQFPQDRAEGVAQRPQRAPYGRAEEEKPHNRAAEGQRRHIKTQRSAGGSHAQQEQRRRRGDTEKKIREHAGRGAGALPQNTEQVIEEAEAHAG